MNPLTATVAASAQAPDVASDQPDDHRDVVDGGGGGALTKWWFWTILVAVVAGGVTAAILLGPANQGPEEGSLGSATLGLRF